MPTRPAKVAPILLLTDLSAFVAILMEPLNTNNNEGNVFSEGHKIERRYVNYFKIGHNAFEFVIDLGQYFPETDQAELYTRIVTSPFYANSLLETLQESIYRYEKSFGPIKES